MDKSNHTYIINVPDFVEKYIEREIADRGLKKSVTLISGNITPDLLDLIQEGSNVVIISSTEVYGLTEGNGITEGAIADPTSPLGVRALSDETLAASCCASKGCLLTILRCPDIVGTGMQGRLRALVNSIYRGFYHHIDDETASLSVVHAVDVARAAVTLGGNAGTFHLTDGQDPTLRDLTDALAFRMAGKRIYTLRRRRADIIAAVCDYIPGVTFGSETLKERYKSLTFSSDKIQTTLGWQPTSVVQYLRNHIYDENSL